jgi:hypothetical protein
MLYDVIIKFCINLWGFSINPPYFGYNSVEHETPVLCILMFWGPSGTQIDQRFFFMSIFT